jgi:hypothetical protein
LIITGNQRFLAYIYQSPMVLFSFKCSFHLSLKNVCHFGVEYQCCCKKYFAYHLSFAISTDPKAFKLKLLVLKSTFFQFGYHICPTYQYSGSKIISTPICGANLHNILEANGNLSLSTSFSTKTPTILLEC